MSALHPRAAYYILELHRGNVVDPADRVTNSCTVFDITLVVSSIFASHGIITLIVAVDENSDDLHEYVRCLLNYPRRLKIHIEWSNDAGPALPSTRLDAATTTQHFNRMLARHGQDVLVVQPQVLGMSPQAGSSEGDSFRS